MKVVVTGATGHLGNVVARREAARGNSVCGLSRSEPGFTLPEGVEWRRCDLSDRAGLADAIRGADIVYHTAGYVSIGINQGKRLHSVNVAGTQNVIDACVNGEGGRLVYISSIEAINLRNSRITEETPIMPESTLIPYGRSKALATLAVERAVETRGLDAVALFPTGFVGPYDYRMSAMTAMVRDFAGSKVPIGINGGFYFVDVRDVADVAIRAADYRGAHRRFLVPGSYSSISDIFRHLQAITGVQAPRVSVPLRIARLWGGIAELYYALAKKLPRYTSKSLKILASKAEICGTRAQEELAHDPMPIEQSFRDTVEWLEKAGLIAGGE